MKNVVLFLLMLIGFFNLAEAQNVPVMPALTVQGNAGSTQAPGKALPTGNVLNVLQLGVVCDGSTDNKTALTAITTRATTGYTIYFPPVANECLTSGAITPNSGVTLWAYPGTVTIGPTATSTASPLLYTSANKSNILVYGLTFDGGGQAFAGGNPNTLQSYRDTNTVFDHVTVQNTRGIGLLFSGSIQSGVRDSTFTNIGNGWVVSGTTTDRAQGISICCQGTVPLSDNFVTNNMMTNIGLDAISVGGVNTTITGNHCEMLDYNILTNLTGVLYSACVYTASLSNSIISNNYSNQASGNAYDNYNSSNLLINGNYAIASGSAGIGVFGASNTTVTGNVALNNNQANAVSTCSYCSDAGISLSNGGYNITVAGNVASDTQSTKTQLYGFQALKNSSNYLYYNIYVDPNNMFAGNSISPFVSNGVIPDYTISRTGSGALINSIGASPNGSLQLQASGTGEVDITDPNGYTRWKATTTTVDSGVTGSAGASFRVSNAYTSLISSDLTTYSYQSPGNTITNNVAYAPNGTFTAASMLTANGTNINQYRYKSISTGVSGVLYTWSAYFQPISSSTQNYASLYLSGTAFGAGSNYGIVVNTQTCAYSSLPNPGTGGATPTSYSVTAVANGWCKVVVSQRATATGSYIPIISNASSGGQIAFTGDGTGVYVWGVDLESNTENFYTAKGAVAGSAPLLASNVNPTISSGFGTSAAILPTAAGTFSFSVNVGTGGTASTGVIAMPTSTNGWACSVHDVTTPSTNLTDQTGSTTSSVSLTNFVRTTGVAGAWNASDVLELQCAPN